MLVLVVVMGFLRMRRSVHAKKNLPHQISKDKARLQSAKCRCPQNAVIRNPGAAEPAVWKPPSLGSIVRRDGCDAAKIATDGMRCSRRSVDPDSVRDRRLDLSNRAGGSGIPALGTGSERGHS